VEVVPVTETETYNRNSEILFIYEAQLCNPNGDPDDENRPRMDPRTGRNLVSDVRLKRFFRNYIMNRYGEEHIWVSTVEGKHVRADERLRRLGEGPERVLAERVLDNCIDARLFGPKSSSYMRHGCATPTVTRTTRTDLEWTQEPEETWCPMLG
jgi:CRISPR-associated protein Csh2